MSHPLFRVSSLQSPLLKPHRDRLQIRLNALTKEINQQNYRLNSILLPMEDSRFTCMFPIKRANKTRPNIATRIANIVSRTEVLVLRFCP